MCKVLPVASKVDVLRHYGGVEGAVEQKEKVVDKEKGVKDLLS